MSNPTGDPPQPTPPILGYAAGASDEPVVLRSFATSWEAHLACGKVENGGVGCQLADEYSNTIGYALPAMTGGIKLMVRRQDLAEAQRILDTPMDPIAEDDTEALSSEPDVCPRCGSLRTRPREKTFVWRWVNALLLGIPSLFSTTQLECEDCRTIFTDEPT